MLWCCWLGVRKSIRPVKNWVMTDEVLVWLSVWTVAPPEFSNRGEVRYGSIGSLECEVPQSQLYCLCINVALCSTTLQCICRVIRRSSMTMNAHTYYIIFGRPPIRGKLPPPWQRHCVWSEGQIVCIRSSWCHCIPKPHNLLHHLNPDWFYLSGTVLTQAVLEKRPLNGRSSYCD